MTTWSAHPGTLATRWTATAHGLEMEIALSEAWGDHDGHTLALYRRGEHVATAWIRGEIASAQRCAEAIAAAIAGGET